MNIEKTIDAMIQNRIAIYKLYKQNWKNLSSNLEEKSVFEDAGNSTIDKIGKKTGMTPFSFCMDFLLKKEEEYIELLEMEDYYDLEREIEKLKQIVPSIEDNFIEQYIENGSNLLPYLRVIRTLEIILSEKERLVQIDEEESNVVMMEKEEKGYQNLSEAVVDQIRPELEQQYLAHFINIAFKNEATYKNTPYEELIKNLPYDFIYLSEFWESHLVYDNIAYLPYTLFLVEDIYPEYFYTKKTGRQAIEEDVLSRINEQLLLLSTKKMTLTNNKAFLRCLYIETLCEEVDEEFLEDLIMNQQDILDAIEYSFPILVRLREIRQSLLAQEEGPRCVKKRKGSVSKRKK